jgi:hypothetical protein
MDMQFVIEIIGTRHVLYAAAQSDKINELKLKYIIVRRGLRFPLNRGKYWSISIFTLWSNNTSTWTYFEICCWILYSHESHGQTDVIYFVSVVQIQSFGAAFSVSSMLKYYFNKNANVAQYIPLNFAPQPILSYIPTILVMFFAVR